ncbi:hypothetical protein HKCCE4037_00970 [Rhodobacterales bacterium HKCCE4037]|nr:hypothetical protein [Rhodobacterales bacterium HKCCE4037]
MSTIAHQSFACVLAIEPESERIIHVSENAAELLGVSTADLLSRDGCDHLDRLFWHALRNGAARPEFRSGVTLSNAGALGERFDLRAFPSGSLQVVEAAPRRTSEFGSTPLPDVVQSVMTQLLPSRDETELARDVVKLMRHILAADRVCFWRIGDQTEAILIAETKRRAVPSASGQTIGAVPHWPSSAPPVEIIADVSAPAISLVSEDGAPASDLSLALARLPAPNRLEQLRGDGMVAAFRLFLTRAGQPWAFVDAEFLTPRRPSAQALSFVACLAPFLDAKAQSLPHR